MPAEESTYINHYETYRNRAIRPPLETAITDRPFCNTGNGLAALPWFWIAAGVAGGLVISGLTRRKIKVVKK